MDQKEQNVDVSIELSGNIVTARKMWPAEMRTADDLVRSLVGYYDKAPFIPDNRILVLRCPLSDSVLENDYLDISLWMKENAERKDVAVFQDIHLRLAAYCISRKLQLTPDDVQSLKTSPGYAAFYSAEEEKRWHCQEMLLTDLPHEQRYDDWSFVFGTTERGFSTREQQDILTLGLLMSTGIDREFHTPARVPSHHLLKPYFDRLDFVTYGNPSCDERDIADAFRSIRAAAGRILAGKYPEVAPIMHERCGLPLEMPGSEIYALVKGSDEAVDVRCNLRGDTGFYDYLARHVFSQKERVGEFADDCAFFRYRLDEQSLMPPGGLTKQEMWERLRKTTGERGIEPLDRIPFIDALYCLRNGRNPLHPANARRHLPDEKLYRDVYRTLTECSVAQEIHIDTDICSSPCRGRTV